MIHILRLIFNLLAEAGSSCLTFALQFPSRLSGIAHQPRYMNLFKTLMTPSVLDTSFHRL